MPTPLPLPLRQLIVHRAQQGQDVATIAHALHVPARTVRHLLQRFGRQADQLRPAYRPGPGRPAPQQPVYDLALALRQQHPTWGAGYIRVRLGQAYAASALPSERALQRWFRQQQRPPAPPGRRPPTEATRAQRPHERWQMDAVEQLRLGSGQGVSWLRLVDECSGAFLGTTVFPPLPLGARPGDRRPGAVAARFWLLGPAGRPARGQRHALGLVE
jgi:Homeodomain-like domain